MSRPGARVQDSRCFPFRAGVPPRAGLVVAHRGSCPGFGTSLVLWTGAHWGPTPGLVLEEVDDVHCIETLVPGSGGSWLP